MEITPDLLKRYMQGKCSAEEKRAVELWNKNPKETVSDDVELPPSLEDKIWGNIDLATKGKVPGKSRIVRGNFKKIGIAASILFVIGFGLWFFTGSKNTIITDAGETDTLVLEDGTKVYLNAMTKLELPKRFADKERQVFLEGEAFFEVAKEADRPFIVNTNSTRTEVLGTSFNIYAYEAGADRLTLKEGKVLLSKNGNPERSGLILKAGDHVTLQNDSLIKSQVNVDNQIAWISNVMVFENEAFAEVAKKIERKFDIKISIEDEKLKSEPFQGRFKDPKLNILLEDLSFVLKFDYKTKGDKIIIY